MTPSSVWEQLGLAIGHATDVDGATGCTVIRGVTAPFRCSVALLGRASGTRELATCAPEHLVDRTDAVLFTGGSAYGLDAAAGVMRWMEERGRGFPVGPGVVPIVPAAVVFDLAPLGQFTARPTPSMAYAACDSASSNNSGEGCIGAGTGTLVGKCTGVEAAMKGGVGLGEATGGDVVATAIAVVNAFGDVRDGAGRIIAGARSPDGSFVDTERLLRSHATPTRFAQQVEAEGRRNTTLVLVAVSVPLDKLALSQLAQAATAAFHRRITPCGTSFDGDVLFAVSPLPIDGVPTPPVPLARIEAVAIAAIEQAIERGVRTARGRDGIPGLADNPLRMREERNA